METLITLCSGCVAGCVADGYSESDATHSTGSLTQREPELHLDTLQIRSATFGSGTRRTKKR
jgi:hypothetical protein